MSNLVFVSYFYSISDNGRMRDGYGQMTIKRDAPVATGDDIIAIADTVKLETGCTSVVILNFRRLESDES